VSVLSIESIVTSSGGPQCEGIYDDCRMTNAA